MKPLLLLLSLPFVAHSQAINSTKFGRSASASISRVSLFRDNNGTTVAPNVLWSQFDATKRSSLIAVLPQDSNIKIRVLAENTPDAALEAVAKITNSLKTDKLEVTSALEFSRSIAQIKRSASVENFRVLSYRIAELLNADGTMAPAASALFDQLIKASATTAEADAKTANTEALASIEEQKTLLAKQKNISIIIEQLTAQLKEAKDDETKKRLNAQLVSLVN